MIHKIINILVIHRVLTSDIVCLTVAFFTELYDRVTLWYVKYFQNCSYYDIGKKMRGFYDRQNYVNVKIPDLKVLRILIKYKYSLNYNQMDTHFHNTMHALSRK